MQLAALGLVRKTVLRGALAAGLIRAGGAALALLVHVSLARILGVEGFGIYVHALSFMVVLAPLATLGFDSATVRYVAQYAAARQWGLLKSHLHAGAAYTGAVSTIVGVTGLVFVFFGDSIAGPTYRATFGFALLLIPILALSSVRQAAVRGFKQSGLALFPDQILRPLLLLAGALGVTAAGEPLSAPGTMALHVLAGLGALVAGGISLVVCLRRQCPEARPAAWAHREWLSTSLPLMLVAGAGLLLSQLDVLMLGALRSAQSAGIYSASVRLSEFMAFGLLSINMIVGPMVAEQHAARSREALRHTAVLASRLAFAFAAVVGVALAIAGDTLLGFYGEAFRSGRWSLWILVGGQLVNAATGSVGLLLTMTGRQNAAAKIFGSVLALNAVLNAMLIPYFGMAGAATSTAVAVILWNAWMALEVKRSHGFWPFFWAGGRRA